MKNQEDHPTLSGIFTRYRNIFNPVKLGLRPFFCTRGLLGFIMCMIAL